MIWWRRFRSWLNRAIPQHETWIALGRWWRLSAWLLLIAVVVTMVSQAANLYGLIGISAIIGLLLLIVLGVWLLLLLVARLPSGARGGMLLLAVPLIPVSLFGPAFAVLYLTLLLSIGFLATGILRFSNGLTRSGLVFAAVGGLPLLVGGVLLIKTGWEAEQSADWPPLVAPLLSLADPSDPGAYTVARMSYGSGADLHRVEFAAAADWHSASVDGSSLIDGWEGAAGWSRSGFWGFDATELPVQGRVWLPEGDGPFPLVLIVHGNHEMSDFSDVGYDYLGELFASRGIVTVSVDENFLNFGLADLIGGPDAGLEEESDARGWMLLQHLVQWRDWNADPDHPMYGKVDLDRVVLIGHSRGGEAVSEAAHFNRLTRYPDDGNLAFDFSFGIRGIIAIAPVDSQYHPRDQDTRLNDISLLVIHGSHDSDVDAFVGTAMYSRLEFDACQRCFKSSFYLLGANHGQFNSSWGRYDTLFPAAWLLNVDPLMDATAQRQVAKVVFSAFLETVLNDSDDYRAFMAQPERGDHWLPAGTSYLTNYADPAQIMLADFEDDADLVSAGEVVEQVRASGFSIWKELEVPLRWRTQDSAAVLLGWGGDELTESPTFEIRLLQGGLAVTPDMALTFSAAMGTEAPEGVEDFEAPQSLDFEIELFDTVGQGARVPLSRIRPLYAQVDPVLYKLEALNTNDASEVVFQRYVVSFSDWMLENPELDLNRLGGVRFRFPKETPASVWLDDIAIIRREYQPVAAE